MKEEKAADPKRIEELREKDYLTPNETIELFDLSRRKFYALMQSGTLDFTVNFRSRKFIIRTEFEKQIGYDLDAQLDPIGRNMTVKELVARYISTKTGVKANMKIHYQTVQGLLEKEEFNDKKISSIRTSDAKLFLIKLQEDGRGYSTVKTVRGVLRPAFQMAVDDDILMKNPFGFEFATVVVNDSVTREPILEDREAPAAEKMIGGKTGFLYLDKNGYPLVAMHWQHRFRSMVNRYNDIYRVEDLRKAQEEMDKLKGEKPVTKSMFNRADQHKYCQHMAVYTPFRSALNRCPPDVWCPSWKR